MDVVLDLIGGKMLASSYILAKRGGIIVTANQRLTMRHVTLKG